jgi:hypothetical protein
MGCKVYANNSEISCKGGANKVIAEFPDVCLSPPSPPAGPIPVPYPDTSFSKDMRNGSRTVKIKKKEIMLKDKSFYKTSPLGDEAATNGLGANVITHTITGKTYCVSWSMDVKVEGENVDRHMDITTSNHFCSNAPAGTGPFSLTLAEMAVFVVRDVKDAARWSRHVNPNTCNGNHDWQCNKKACPDCWQPKCDTNAEKEQKNYEREQSGLVEDKMRAHKESNTHKRRKGHDPRGLKWEEAATQKISADEEIKYIGYSAHCARCHMQGDLDIVTATSIIECKRTAKSASLPQMRDNIKAIRDKCFPGKELKIATPAGELQRLRDKLRQKDWAAIGVTAIDP